MRTLESDTVVHGALSSQESSRPGRRAVWADPGPPIPSKQLSYIYSVTGHFLRDFVSKRDMDKDKAQEPHTLLSTTGGHSILQSAQRADAQ